MDVLPACASYGCSIQRDQKRASDLWKQIQMVVSLYGCLEQNLASLEE